MKQPESVLAPPDRMHEEQDRVVFYVSSVRIGIVAAILVVWGGVTVILAVTTGWPPSVLRGLVALFGLVIGGLGLRHRLVQLRRAARHVSSITVFDNMRPRIPEQECASGICVDRCDIGSIVVSEAMAGDDSPTFIEIRLMKKADNASSVLILQRNPIWRRRVTAMARHLSKRWGVELRIEEPHCYDLGFLAYVFLLGGIGLVAHGGSMVAKQRAILHWPSTQAVILDVDLNIMEESASPSVSYEYTVRGEKYISTRINPSRFNYQSEDSVRKDLGALRRGAYSQCYYNPLSPSESYLVSTGVSIGPVVMIASGLFFLGISFIELIQRARRWYSSCYTETRPWQHGDERERGISEQGRR